MLLFIYIIIFKLILKFKQGKPPSLIGKRVDVYGNNTQPTNQVKSLYIKLINRKRSLFLNLNLDFYVQKTKVK